MVNTINKETPTLLKNNIRLISIGNTTQLPDLCQKNLKEAIEKHKPTLVLISLGSNELFTPKKLLPEYEKYLDNILLQLENTNFIWICPPNWKKDFGLTDLILEKVQENRFFPSRDLKIPRAGDGIHPTMHGYEMWADKILNFILESPQKPMKLVCETKEKQINAN